jgi:hypothetical protein
MKTRCASVLTRRRAQDERSPNGGRLEGRLRIIRRGTNEFSHIWMRISAGSRGNMMKDLSVSPEEPARARFPKSSALESTSDAILEFDIGNFDVLGNDQGSVFGFLHPGNSDLVLHCLVLEMDCRYFRDVLARVPFWRLTTVNLKLLDP